MVTGSTFQDPVHSRPSQPLDNPSISFDAGPQLGPRRSNKSSMRSERTSLQSTSTDDTLSVSTRGNNPSHSFGSTQASDHHLRPKDSLSDPSHSLRTPYKASLLPHRPHKVLREHRLTTPDPEPYVIPKPSDTRQDNLDKEYTSLATKYIPRALKITETDNMPDRTLSKPKDTQRASSAATTELERLEMTLSSYLHSRNNQHESSTCPQTAASTLSRPGNTAKSSTTPKSQYKVEYKEPPTVYNKAQALLLNPKDYSFSDSSEIVKYLPYAPDTAISDSSLDIPGPFQVLTAPIEPLLQESSRQSSKSSPHRSTEKQQLIESQQSQPLLQEPTVTEIAEDILQIVESPTPTAGSQAPSIDLMLLDKSDWFSEVMSCLEQPVGNGESTELVHIAAKPEI
ncbi:unnamed protein product [Rhizoctonia solani]|uniref:Uncharacterized protein n=1 Tax=Rhizoctonia solani TaxID=456999 RepID=A0A8H3B6K8_9AGAM|nr:unnamed protein product [Rhizoctonia solani]